MSLVLSRRAIGRCLLAGSVAALIIVSSETNARAESLPAPNQYNTTPDTSTFSIDLVSDSSPVCGPWNLPDDTLNPNEYGQCTYWAVEKRPDLQKVVNEYGYAEYGGAFDWKIDAVKASYAVDQTPVVGDIAALPPGDSYSWTYTNSTGSWLTFMFTADPKVGHVAYVEQVNTDGSFVMSEMNTEWAAQGDMRYVPAAAASGMYFIHQPGYTPHPVTVLPMATVTAKRSTVQAGNGHRDKFTVKLSAASSSALTIGYEVEGNAINGTDYHLLPGTLTIPPGQTSAAIAIVPLGDLGGAAKKIVKIKLAPASAYTVGTASPVAITIVAGK